MLYFRNPRNNELVYTGYIKDNFYLIQGCIQNINNIHKICVCQIYSNKSKSIVIEYLLGELKLKAKKLFRIVGNCDKRV